MAARPSLNMNQGFPTTSSSLSLKALPGKEPQPMTMEAFLPLIKTQGVYVYVNAHSIFTLWIGDSRTNSKDLRFNKSYYNDAMAKTWFVLFHVSFNSKGDCLIYHVKIIGTNFPADGPVMTNKSQGWEPSREILYTENGVLRGQSLMALKVGENRHLVAHLHSTYR